MACRIFITSCRIFCCGTWTLTALFRLSGFGTWALELWPAASRVHRPSNCRVWASWILVSWPGLKLVFLALQDGFLTIGPPGKSLAIVSRRQLLLNLPLRVHGLFCRLTSSQCHSFSVRILCPQEPWGFRSSRAPLLLTSNLPVPSGSNNSPDTTLNLSAHKDP